MEATQHGQLHSVPASHAIRGSYWSCWQRARIWLRCELTLMSGGPTGWHSAAASALVETVKKRTISREAVSCNAVLARSEDGLRDAMFQAMGGLQQRPLLFFGWHLVFLDGLCTSFLPMQNYPSGYTVVGNTEQFAGYCNK